MRHAPAWKSSGDWEVHCKCTEERTGNGRPEAYGTREVSTGVSLDPLPRF